VLSAYPATRPGLQPRLMIIPALAGWCFLDYPAAIHLLNDPLAVSPNNGCGNPFRRSESSAQGYIPYRRAEDFDPAIALAPESPGVRVIVADAYTYGNVPGPQPAFAESILRVRRSSKHATCSRHFASAYLPLGNQLAAAAEFRKRANQAADLSFGKGKIRMATARRLSSVSDLKARDEITSANACRRES
jgi:hypothetical protein